MIEELLDKISESDTPDPKANLDLAIQKYLGMKIPDKVMLSSKSMGCYGKRSSGGIVVDIDTARKEHPAFIAGVIYHEYYHNVLTKQKVRSADQESRVRYKTKIWASLEAGKYKEDPEALAAFKKVISLSGQ
ncbi:MAG: hypothetical protein IMZ47_06500 [Firmicutes bacterium]|nr:hypothetical protein [Bacillota bacterium]